MAVSYLFLTVLLKQFSHRSFYVRFVRSHYKLLALNQYDPACSALWTNRPTKKQNSFSHVNKNRVSSAVKTDPKAIEMSLKKISTDSLKAWAALMFFWLGLKVLSILNDYLVNHWSPRRFREWRVFISVYLSSRCLNLSHRAQLIYGWRRWTALKTLQSTE